MEKNVFKLARYLERGDDNDFRRIMQKQMWQPGQRGKKKIDEFMYPFGRMGDQLAKNLI